MSLPTIGSMLDAAGSFARGQSIAQQSINQRLQRDEADQMRAYRERQINLQEQEAIQKFQAQQAEQKLIEESFNKPEEVLPLIYARDPNKAKAVADQIQNTYQQKYQTANFLLKTDAQNKQFYYERALPELQQQFPNIQFGDKFSPEIQKQLKREADFVKSKINTVYSLQETARGIESFNPKTGDLGGAIAPIYQKPPSTVVNVGGEQPAFRKKLEETYGTKIAERIDKVNTDATNAMEAKQWLGLQREALNNLDSTGPLDAPKIFLGNLANQLGVEVNLNKVSKLEQLSAAGNAIAIPLVKQLGYNPTDADAKLIISTIANIGKGKATNEQLLDVIEQATDKKIREAELTDRLREEGREKDLTKELREFNASNPVKIRDLNKSKQSSKAINYQEYFK